jgi:uncharacterized protein (TIGR00299 family) protein
MKSLYFDMHTGASGDMILSALYNLGQVTLADLKRPLVSLHPAYKDIRFQLINRQGINGHLLHTRLPHEHAHRHLADIRRMVQKSRLTGRAQCLTMRIFTRLAAAEAKVHGTTPEKIHFHEVGGLDSIMDIAGAAIMIDRLDIRTFGTSVFTLGSGEVHCSHGIFPVPAPATVELIRGFAATPTEIRQELVTPTGAAVISTLVKGAKMPDSYTLVRAGYGMGSRIIPGHPNHLRVLLGESDDSSPAEICVIQCNLDDSTPEIIAFLMEQLLAAGALDATLQPVIMKKNRMATQLTVLCEPGLRDRLVQMIFAESSSLGVRFSMWQRIVLPRRMEKIKTPWGLLPVKVTELNGKRVILPEYEVCKKIAVIHDIPLKTVYKKISTL